MMKMNQYRYAVAISLVCLATTSFSAEDVDKKEAAQKLKKNTYELAPVLLKSDQSNSSTLGLEYSLKGDLFTKDFKKECKESDDVFNFDCTYGDHGLAYDLSGVVAENAENNPKNFLTSEVNYQFSYYGNKHNFRGGAFLQYETDQKFDNKQYVYGGTFTYVPDFEELGINALKDDTFAAHINLAQVDPKDDTAREAVLEDLDTYDRLGIELVYKLKIDKGILKHFEANYRYYKELGADDVIKDAGLDDFRLVTYRLGLKNGAYVAYSSGELPFNLQDDQIFEIGYSYSLDKLFD